MQCYRIAVLVSTIAVCCCLLVPFAIAGDTGSWVASPGNQSREPERMLQTRPAQPESNRQFETNQSLASNQKYESQPQRGSAVPQANVQQQNAVTTANYVEPQQQTLAAAQQTAHSETRTPLPKLNAAAKKAKSTSSSGGWKSLVSAVSGLIFVIAIFVGLAFLARKIWQPAGSGSLPKQVFEVLGRSSYAPRQQVVLMRFGNKVLLVNHELGNVQTLSEIETEEEVERIVAACQQNSSSSLSANFGNVLSQVIHGNGDRSQNKRSLLSKALPVSQTRRVV